MRRLSRSMRYTKSNETRFLIRSVHIAREPDSVEISLSSDGPFDDEWLMWIFNTATTVTLDPDRSTTKE